SGVATLSAGATFLLGFAGERGALRARRIDGGGRVLDDPALLLGSAAGPAAAAFAGGVHLVAWNDGDAVRLARLDGHGIVAVPLRIEPAWTVEGSPAIAAGHGMALLAWIDGEVGG